MSQQQITSKPAAAKVSAAKLKELESRIQPATAADKPKAAKAATKKAVSKAAPKAKAKAAPAKIKATVTAVKFALGQSCRPNAGRALVAYTAAWMALTGFADGKGIARATVAKIAGERAIAYHKQAGNFEDCPDGLRLSAKGRTVFASRAPEEAMVNAYTAMMKDGTLNPDHGITKTRVISLAA